ncbi:MAG: hypothetical protein KGQ46_02660 [Hyphomicrobiales bacterium]|nr:hypothetical protein [Hyphomicrobiales bacterium]MDE2113688.1 hypothetical protein [Hyphomicrobiales bacterium]
MLQKFTKAVLPWVVATSFALGVSVAQAETVAHHHYRHPHHKVVQVPARTATPEPVVKCVPWCPTDLLPCDPPEYKNADGRCAPFF